jgi:hypothetical protein
MWVNAASVSESAGLSGFVKTGFSYLFLIFSVEKLLPSILIGNETNSH